MENMKGKAAITAPMAICAFLVGAGLLYATGPVFCHHYAAYATTYKSYALLTGLGIGFGLAFSGCFWGLSPSVIGSFIIGSFFVSSLASHMIFSHKIECSNRGVTTIWRNINGY